VFLSDSWINCILRSVLAGQIQHTPIQNNFRRGLPGLRRLWPNRRWTPRVRRAPISDYVFCRWHRSSFNDEHFDRAIDELNEFCCEGILKRFPSANRLFASKMKPRPPYTRSRSSSHNNMNRKCAASLDHALSHRATIQPSQCPEVISSVMAARLDPVAGDTDALGGRARHHPVPFDFLSLRESTAHSKNSVLLSMKSTPNHPAGKS